MVRAILAGKKTQTRRILDLKTGEWARTLSSFNSSVVSRPHNKLSERYGYPGDRLWVRETWRPKSHQFPTGWPWEYKATCAQDLTPADGPWRPSIHMPRAASRILLEVTDVRIERLQEISRDDARAEGVFFDDDHDGFITDTDGSNFHYPDPRISFCKLWCGINGPESWDSNPWVWVISFSKISEV
jgi:hypothetical protein